MRIFRFLGSVGRFLFGWLEEFFNVVECSVCKKYMNVTDGIRVPSGALVCSSTCAALSRERDHVLLCYVCDQPILKDEARHPIGLGFFVHVGSCQERAEGERVVGV